MRTLVLLGIGLATLVTSGATAEETIFRYPQVAEYGGIVRTPDAAEPPRKGAKIVFDIVADSEGDEVNKGLQNVARYLNLNAEAGLAPGDIKLALVLHGGATKAALNQTAYAKQTTVANNPNLPLIRKLKAAGVEVYVCAQSLARSQLDKTAVAAEVTVAVSAMTVNVNKQLDGYAYLSIR